MKKKIFILTMLLFVVFNTKAQTINIDFTNGSSSSYNLSEVRKITFSGSDMLLVKTDGAILTWATSDISKYYYNDISTEINTVEENIKNLDVLIYPNPSEGDLKIDFQLSNNDNVNISLNSIDGRLIEKILNKNLKKGQHSINWKNNNLSSGNYFVTIETSKNTTSKKLIILN